MDEQKVAMKVLKDIALDNEGRVIAERQRAVGALTLFREEGAASLEEIAKKCETVVIRELAIIYSNRIKDGVLTNMTL